MNQQKGDQLDRLAKHPVLPPADASLEPTDANPVPLSPTEPHHRTSNGAQKPAAQPVVAAVPASGLGGGATGAGNGLPLAVPVTLNRTADETSNEDQPLND